MPKSRPPKDVWDVIRKKVWDRDNHRCVHCNCVVSLYECNIDHIKSGKCSTNSLKNLRTLCRRCHVLRADIRHRGMISKALNDGIIPPNWRELVWDD